jgi:hypothetical protein
LSVDLCLVLSNVISALTPNFTRSVIDGLIVVRRAMGSGNTIIGRRGGPRLVWRIGSVLIDGTNSYLYARPAS